MVAVVALFDSWVGQPYEIANSEAQRLVASVLVAESLGYWAGVEYSADCSEPKVAELSPKKVAVGSVGSG